MSPPLHSLFESMAIAPNEQALRSTLMDGLGDAFDVHRWGIYLLDSEGRLGNVDVVGVSDAFVERYEKIGREVDPVLQYVLENHAPAHEELVLPPGQWQRSELYQRCCSKQEHSHIMTGPIVGRGQLVGTVHFARVGPTPAFTSHELGRLGAICTHFSACLAALRSPISASPNAWVGRLTARERQIANLVAQGLTNAEIGTELWITRNSVKQALKRMFRKLDVASRTEMVAKLRDR